MSLDDPNASLSMPESSVQVVVRLRPMNDRELQGNTLPVITASTADRTVTVLRGTGSRQQRSMYQFDNVFTSFSTQQEVFDNTLKPVIKDVLMGYESTVFAYGQTGTGKTHTMEGDINDPEQQGIIPRSAHALFEKLQEPEYLSSEVTCSYLEIYNEELCDLLAPTPSASATAGSLGGGKGAPCAAPEKLEIMDSKTGTFCRGLSELPVKDAADVLSLMQKACQSRRIGETKMNKQSSRSHCLFTISVRANVNYPGTGVMEVGGKLHMVDLAGSECAKTAALGNTTDKDTATRERERMNINRSLLTLGRVISCLKEQSSSKSIVRIPYRDSKLTRVLQESLGGRCKTVIIATLSPSISAIEESVSTLNYAQSANGIVNKPVATSYLSVGGALGDGKHSSGGVGAGGNAGAGGTDGTGLLHWHEMECRLQYMQTQVDEAQAALARKHTQQMELVARAETAELARKEGEIALEKQKELNETIKVELVEAEKKNKKIADELSKTQLEVRKCKFVLKSTRNVEEVLTREASALLETLRTSIRDGDDIFSELQQRIEVEDENKMLARTYRETACKVLEGVAEHLESLETQFAAQRSKLVDCAAENREKSAEAISNMSASMTNLSLEVKAFAASMRTALSDGVAKTAADLKHESRKVVEAIQGIVEEKEGGLKMWSDGRTLRLQELSAALEKSEAEFAMKSASFTEVAKGCVHKTKAVLTNIESQLSTIVESSSTKRADVLSNVAAMTSDVDDLAAKSFCALDVMAQNGTVTASAAGKEQEELLVRQKTLIAKHENSLEEAKQQQAAAHAAFLESMKASFESLIAEQSQKLIQISEKQMAEQLQLNKEMSSNNCEAEKATSTFVESVTSSFVEVAALSSSSRAGQKAVFDNLSAELDRLKTLDDENVAATTAVKAGVVECGEFVGGTMIFKIQDGIESLKTAAVEQMDAGIATYGEEIESIASMVTARSELVSTVSAKGQSLVEDVMTAGFEKIDAVTGGVCIECEKVVSSSASAAVTASSAADASAFRLAAFVAETNICGEAMSTTVSECTGSVSAVVASSKVELENYMGDIKVDEDVEDAEARESYIFVESLTSTPEENIVLRFFNVADESQNANGLAVADHFAVVGELGGGDENADGLSSSARLSEGASRRRSSTGTRRKSSLGSASGERIALTDSTAAFQNVVLNPDGSGCGQLEGKPSVMAQRKKSLAPSSPARVPIRAVARPATALTPNYAKKKGTSVRASMAGEAGDAGAIEKKRTAGEKMGKTTKAVLFSKGDEAIGA